MLFKVYIDSLCLTFPLMNFAAESDTEDSDGEELGPVSYTHLTLPTSVYV